MNSYINDYQTEMDTIQYLCKRAAKFKLLTPEEERELLIQTKNPDPKIVKKAYAELIDRNLRLVIKKAREFIGRGLPLEDLVQEGITGLIRAIEKFDLNRGARLSTYGTRWIEQRVRRALENKSRLVKISGNKLSQITALKKAYKKYTEDMNRSPTSEEIAEILNISEREAAELGRLMYSHVSLDETVGEDDNLSMINYLVDDTPSPEDKAENLEDKIYINNLLSFLTKEDSDFMKLCFGFLDNKERTPREMAQILNCNVKTIKERKEKILKRLKEIAEYEKVNYII